MIENAQYLKEVREQYENYPYPKREPENEKSQLLTVGMERLDSLSHYCFKGDMKLSPKGEGEKIRFLIAGGGTGDSAIYSAEVLRDFNAEVVYLDMSSSSMAVAKKRAEIRQLDNITWIHNSLLELPDMDIGEFDYINCSGVLHHLESPVDGLKALKSVLKPDGAMGIMVYGLYGRTGIYQIQELMRKINSDEPNLQTKVDNTKTILGSLPNTNWYKRDENRWKTDVEGFGDIGIYDLFLHSQDRAYTVPQLYEWVEEQVGLKIIDFIGQGLEGKIGYRPETFIKDPQLLEKVQQLPKIEQQAIAELMSGHVRKHTFYLTNRGSREDAKASVKDGHLVPYFASLDKSGEELADIIANNPEKNIKFSVKNQGDINFKPLKNTEKIFRLIDGQRTINEIFSSIPEVSKDELKSELAEILKIFGDFDVMLLKSKEFPKLKTNVEIQRRVSDLYPDEVKKSEPTQNRGVSLTHGNWF